MKSWIRDHSIAAAAIGMLLAIACTAVLDAVGLSGINVLPLVPLLLLFWYLQHLSRVEIGLIWGRWRDYGLAVLYPALVLALIGLAAWFSGAVTLSKIDWSKTLINLVAMALVTLVGALVTEEGIFRGWLWASLQRARVTEGWVLVWTSAALPPGTFRLHCCPLPSTRRSPRCPSTSSMPA
jgi:membrane protease YdiL (CAAX protease family)